VISLHGSHAHPPDADAPARLAEEIARVLARPGVFVFEVPTVAWAERSAAGGGGRASYVDERSGVAIEIVAHEADAWRRALADFDVAMAGTSPDELRVTARTLG
jgi:SAM-dependent methyltransferase